ncbi:carotenoid ester lipase precursor [Lactarius sanguifluus]|nr:carotenoid ester lipase precursor [Lactarius sanguifluus]
MHRRRLRASLIIICTATATGSTADGLNKFLGIPFMRAPVGDLRFRFRKAPGTYASTHNATAFGLPCPQQATTLAIPNGLSQLEEIKPLWTRKHHDSRRRRLNDGSPIVNHSIALRKPVIYVSMNYRPLLAAFGFLASNLGLWDQRLALRWIQKYTHAFGGDPSKVTIAGSASVSLQMLTNGGNTGGPFRAAFMQSRSPTAVGQQRYDDLVESTGCLGSSDTLACLRAAPYQKLKTAMDSTPSLFVYQPRVDGNFLADVPQKLVQQGKVARIPFVTGDCDDEGALFSLSQTNATTEAGLRNYISEFILPGVTGAELDQLLTLYPQDRIASILGDFTFQAPWRFFMNNIISGQQNTWSFLRMKSLPVLGSVHLSDHSIIYSGGDLTDYLIQFAADLDPNHGGLYPQWPPQLMTLVDTYHVEGTKLLTKLSLAHPL